MRFHPSYYTTTTLVMLTAMLPSYQNFSHSTVHVLFSKNDVVPYPEKMVGMDEDIVILRAFTGTVDGDGDAGTKQKEIMRGYERDRKE